MRLAEHMTEREFQDALVQFAQLVGWRVAHFRNARTGSGAHMTPVAYDGRGFPDLVLVRERVVFVEVKSERGRLRDDQVVWIDDLAAAGVEAYVWRPSDWGAAERVLRRQEGHGH